MPVQETAETTVDAAPEAQADRRMLIDGRLEEFLERKTFAEPVLGASA